MFQMRIGITPVKKVILGLYLKLDLLWQMVKPDAWQGLMSKFQEQKKSGKTDKLGSRRDAAAALNNYHCRTIL